MTLPLVFLLLSSLLAACSPAPGAPLGQTAPKKPLLRLGYYVPEDPASLSSLRQRAGDLDYVGLHWATIRADGSIEMRTNPEVIRLVRSLGAKSLLSVMLNGGAETARVLLASDQSRSEAVESLLRAAADYDGISIDFEGMPSEEREPFTRFMAQLAPRFRSAGKIVTAAISAKTSDTTTGWAGAHDYRALEPHADLFILMSYGFRTAQSSVPGSTAPMSWVEPTLSFALSQIPREKLLLGIPFYGYDWNTTAGPPGRAMRYPDSAALAAQMGARIEYDPVQQAAHFSYTKDGAAHEVWFEDQATLEPKLALAGRNDVAGVAFWRLGHEDPAVWPALRALRPAPVAQVPTPTPTTRPSQPATGQKKSWYFAEGSTAQPFDCWFLLYNPGPAAATARLTFMVEGKGTTTQEMLVPAGSRRSLFANQVVPSAAFSTRVDSDQPIYAERAMYAGFDGHGVTGVSEPSRVWYFAEGATTSPFHTWLLLQNPNPSPATARVTFLLEGGSTSTREVWVAPNSRASLFANQLVPDAAFSTRVESDLPMVAERAMYRFPGNASTGVTGVASPSRNWYFAGGLPSYRGQPFDSWLLLQNPGPNPVSATITFLGSDGRTETTYRVLPPSSRSSLFVSQLFGSGSHGIRVEAGGDIIAERSVFLGPSAISGGEPQGAYATQGAPQLGTLWVLPEGSTAPPFDEKISVLNPHAVPMQVRFEFFPEGAATISHEVTLGPSRNLDLEVDELVPSAGVSARITTSLPSAVERTMFWSKGGKMGAHNSMGIRVE